MQSILLLCLLIVGYTYVGYGILLTLLVKIKIILFPADSFGNGRWGMPAVTLVVPANNEMGCLPAKLDNSLQLDYPTGQLQFLFVTEGSDDGSMAYVESRCEAVNGRILVLRGTGRRGKAAAINRAMEHVRTPVVVFSDAHTMLNVTAVRNLVGHFADPNVGAVAGEKRIQTTTGETAAGAGESLYWRYESYLKEQDAQLCTVVGASGALFALRTDLYQPVETDTLLDDFMISVRIAGRGYRVAYEPNACALERPSLSIDEEKKRRVRIAAGGFQSIGRLPSLLNPFEHGWLTFEYLSHWVLRWAVAPFCLPLIYLLNLVLIVPTDEPMLPGAVGQLVWMGLFIAQCLFYGAAYAGYRLERRQRRSKCLFVPFYFTFVNVCALLGFARYLSDNTTGIREEVRPTDGITLQTD